MKGLDPEFLDQELVGAPRNALARAELLKTVRTLPEYAGVVVDYPGGLRFRVARAGGMNFRMKDALEAALAPRWLAISGGALSEEGATRLLAEVYAQAVVLEWSSEGWGEELPEPGDREGFAEWLTTHTLEFEDLRAIAEDPKNFVGRPREYAHARGVPPADGGPGRPGR